MRPRIAQSIALTLLGCAAPPEGATPSFVPVPNENRLVVHEWGTFTAISGVDGVVLDWRPLDGEDDLPSFVHRLGQEDAGSVKFTMLATQRMETPVLYFYSDVLREVAVEVGFPLGLVTEWYPRAHEVSPASAPPEGARPSGGRIDWGPIALLPRTPERVASLLREPGQSHYYPARETDAALVTPSTVACSDAGPEMDAFLFYRGVGSFDAPIRATLEGDTPIVSNEGVAANGTARAQVPVSRAFAVEVRRGEARFADLGAIAPGESRSPSWGPMRRKETVSAELAAALQASLMTAGLYPKESRAMVETWKGSWLATDGLRILYLLPQTFTDATLPLRVDPVPDEVVRVMVGRLEVLTPWMRREAAALEAASGPSAVRSVYGRLAEPLLAR